MKMPFFILPIFLLISSLSQARNCPSRLGTIRDGATVNGWLTPTGSNASPCLEISITCRNGVLSGPDLFPSCRNTDDGYGDECFDGSTVTGYASSTAPCYPKTIVCVNGRWNGTVSGYCH